MTADGGRDPGLAPASYSRLRCIALILIAAALAGCTGGGPPAAGPERPNVLVVVTDDQTVQEMAALPQTRRWLGGSGIRFSDAYVTTPQCCPSRASILSGRYAHNTGVLDNTDAARLDQSTTVERLLQGNGYSTAIFGKFLNSWNEKHDPPYFDRWAITSHSGRGYDGGRWNVDGRLRNVDVYNTSFLLSRAERFISSARRPWFTYVATAAPHAPFTPQRKYVDARVRPWTPNPATRERNRSDKPPFVRAVRPEIGKIKQIYAEQQRTLKSVDVMMGRLHDFLRQRGELDNTLVFFISDNGLLLGDHGMPAKKAVPYTGSIQVPLFVSWPAVLHPGIRRDPVDNIDIAPTILDATGIRPPTSPPMDGRSLLHGPDRSTTLTEFYSREGRTFPPWASLRTKRFQYVEYYAPNDKRVVFREYYNLVEDAWEKDNLLEDRIGGNGPPTEALHRRLERLRRCSGAACP